MTMKRWDGGSFIDLTVAKRWDGASWIDLTIAKRWDGAVWVDIPLPGGGGGALSVTLSTGNITANNFDPLPAPPFKTLTTGFVTATPTGGTGPYTYSWTRISGDSAPFAVAPTAASTQFRTNIAQNSELSAVFRLTVTDSLAATAFADVTANFRYNTDV